MLLEFLSHAMAFDLGWIAWLIFGNLHWVFAIMAFVIIAGGNKKVAWRFLVTMALLYSVVDLGSLAHWEFATQMVFLPVNFGVTIFTEGTRWQKHFIKIVVVLFFALTFLNTFFLSLPGA